MGVWSEYGEYNDIEFYDILSREILGNDVIFNSSKAILKNHANGFDCPLQNEGDIWKVKNLSDLFTFIAPTITSSDINAYKDIILLALGSINPKYNLPTDKRFYASAVGEDPEYSGWLRKGLASSLICLSIHGDSFKLPGGNSKSMIERIVGDLLKQVNKDGWKGWAYPYNISHCNWYRQF